MQTVIAKQEYDEAKALRGLFEKQLKELYWAEDVMHDMLKNVITKSYSKDLISVLEKHVTETQVHKSRLEQVFHSIGIVAEGQLYPAVKCLIEDADQFMHSTAQGIVRDAGIIALLQKLKHHEIACYGTMRAYAIALREEGIVLLFEQSLQEEKGIDLLLTGVAESHINIEAADKEI
jgi:ferritin-like metal-binding protein YciE